MRGKGSFRTGRRPVRFVAEGAGLCVLLLALGLGGCNGTAGNGQETKNGQEAENSQEAEKAKGAEGQADTSASGQILAESKAKAEKNGEPGQNTVKDTVIAVSMPAAAEGWDYEAYRCAGEYLSQLSDSQTGYILLTASSGEEQAGQLSELVGQNVHSAVIYPADDDSAALGAASLKASGIPVVVFNGTLDSVTADVKVTMDESALGEEGALAAKEAGCEGKEILVFTDESRPETLERLQGFEDNLPDNISIIFGGSSSGTTASARQALLDWIEHENASNWANISGIFATDEDTLLGVLEGLKSYESTYGTVFSGLKLIAGCGSSEELLSWISENENYPVQTWFYPPEAINTAIDLAVDAAKGNALSKEAAIQPQRADYDNVK